jgi:hypothetical protein
MADGRPPGFLTEDLDLRVSGGPPRYRSRTDRPVEYIAIADAQDAVIGHIYANDDDDAAGWHPRSGAEPEALNLAAPWIRMLHGAKARGLAPTAALDDLVARGTDYEENPRSRVAHARRSAVGVAALAEL